MQGRRHICQVARHATARTATTLTRRYDGIFPIAAVNEIIDGRTLIAAHGNRGMEAAVRMRVSNRRSSCGMKCVQCGNDLIAPERSEYWSDKRTCHIWYCRKWHKATVRS